MIKARLTPVRRVLAAFVVALATVAATVGPASAVTNCTPGSDWGTNRTDLAAQVLTLVNQHRASLGLVQLSSSAPLTASAEWKSLHMAKYNYFAHDDPAPPVARLAFTRISDCGYSGGGAGENIAYGYGSAAAVMSGWLNSAGHKANIENASYRSIGIGVAANGSGSLYWTQDFGTTGGSSSPPPPPPPSPPPPPPPSPPAATPPPPPSSPSPASPPSSPVASAPSLAPSTSSGSAPATSAPPSLSQPTPVPVPAPGSVTNVVEAILGPIGATRVATTPLVAGKRTVAKVEILSLGSNRRVTAGSVHCRAEVAGKRLRVVANVFDGGLATCAWRIPPSAKGKVMHGAIGVQVGATNALRLFIRPIR